MDSTDSEAEQRPLTADEPPSISSRYPPEPSRLAKPRQRARVALFISQGAALAGAATSAVAFCLVWAGGRTAPLAVFGILTGGWSIQSVILTILVMETGARPPHDKYQVRQLFLVSSIWTLCFSLGSLATVLAFAIATGLNFAPHAAWAWILLVFQLVPLAVQGFSTTRYLTYYKSLSSPAPPRPPVRSTRPPRRKEAAVSSNRTPKRGLQEAAAATKTRRQTPNPGSRPSTRLPTRKEIGSQPVKPAKPPQTLKPTQSPRSSRRKPLDTATTSVKPPRLDPKGTRDYYGGLQQQRGTLRVVNSSGDDSESSSSSSSHSSDSSGSSDDKDSQSDDVRRATPRPTQRPAAQRVPDCGKPLRRFDSTQRGPDSKTPLRRFDSVQRAPDSKTPLCRVVSAQEPPQSSYKPYRPQQSTTVNDDNAQRAISHWQSYKYAPDDSDHLKHVEPLDRSQRLQSSDAVASRPAIVVHPPPSQSSAFESYKTYGHAYAHLVSPGRSMVAHSTPATRNYSDPTFSHSLSDGPQVFATAHEPPRGHQSTPVPSSLRIERAHPAATADSRQQQKRLHAEDHVTRYELTAPDIEHMHQYPPAPTRPLHAPSQSGPFELEG